MVLLYSVFQVALRKEPCNAWPEYSTVNKGDFQELLYIQLFHVFKMFHFFHISLVSPLSHH